MTDLQIPRKRWLSLTKTQRAGGPGKELLSLLLNVVEDGTLADDEIVTLKNWLAAQGETDLPATAHLAEAVERVLVDGVIEDEEREYLLDRIEAVLPPAEREAARANRRHGAREGRVPRRNCGTEGCSNLLPENAAANRKWCDECRDVRAAPNLCREGDVRGFNFGFKVAGVSFDGRQDVIRKYLRDGDPLMLVRDAANPHDPNAVQVQLANGRQIGFVPREWRGRGSDQSEHTNVEVATCLDAGLTPTARCWKVLTGGQYLGAFVFAKCEGKMQAHPARLQLARERPDSGLATMLKAQADKTARPASSASSTPPFPQSPEQMRVEARAPSAGRAFGTKMLLLGGAVVAVLAAAAILAR